MCGKKKATAHAEKTVPDMKETENPWSAAAVSVAKTAARYAPWSLTVFAVTAFVYFAEEIGQPVFYSLTSDGYYPMPQALGHVRGNLATSLPTVALLWALWEVQGFVGRLARGGLWEQAAMAHLTRLGVAVALAGAIAMFVTPLFTATMSAAQNAKPWPFNPLYVALAGLGAIMFLIARLFRIAVTTAEALKRENDQFI